MKTQGKRSGGETADTSSVLSINLLIFLARNVPPQNPDLNSEDQTMASFTQRRRCPIPVEIERDAQCF